MERVAVLGAGSWGTALAQILADKGFSVSMWMRSAELCDHIARDKENVLYLPGVRLSKNLVPTLDIADAIRGAQMVVSVVPSHGLRAVAAAVLPLAAKDAIIVSATKGIEEGTNLTASGIIKEVFAGASRTELVVLSGPSFAKEVSVNLPAAVCAASVSLESARAVQKAFSTPAFRVYTNSDVTGVELGGALKNVIAIASGISDGLGLGNNARAALITRGLAEMTRLGAAMGANPQTFSGLSGVGDLVLTCTGHLSRNYTVGYEIGTGRPLADVVKGMRMVAEGVRTSKGASALAAKHSVEMPITSAVCDVLYGGKPAKEAVFDLMMRELKGE